jgi:hypothetical protein
MTAKEAKMLLVKEQIGGAWRGWTYCHSPGILRAWAADKRQWLLAAPKSSSAQNRRYLDARHVKQVPGQKRFDASLGENEKLINHPVVLGVTRRGCRDKHACGECHRDCGGLHDARGNVKSMQSVPRRSVEYGFKIQGGKIRKRIQKRESHVVKVGFMFLYP